MTPVAITGVGSVTPFGVGVDPFFRHLVAGESAVRPLHRFAPEAGSRAIGAEIGHPDNPSANLEVADRHEERLKQWAELAAEEAIHQAGNFPGNGSRAGLATSIGWGMPPAPGHFGLHEKEWGERYQVTGITLSSLAACVASTQLVGESALAIAMGEADRILCISADSRLHPVGFSAYLGLQATAEGGNDPSLACRPFDRDRCGFVVGEGAAALILESMDGASARGAHILATVSGFAACHDGYRLTDPGSDGRVAGECLQAAILDAGLSPAGVDLLSLHGTGTPANDAAEARAFHHALGSHASQIPAFSCKHAIGHGSMAAGMLEIIAAVRAMKSNTTPPNPHTLHFDPRISSLNLSTTQLKEVPIATTLKASFGFGGQNAALVLQQSE